MSISVDELATPSGESFKFTSIGDKVVGEVTYVGDWQTKPSNFNPGQTETSLKLVLETVDGPKAIYPKKGSPMAQAIGEAVRAAGESALRTGAKLAVVYSEDKNTGKPQPLKLYAAKYEAPKDGAGVPASDLF